MSEYVFPFEKLDAWQLAVDLADYVIELLEDFPPNQHIRLAGQMEAAVTSPAQNIAEENFFLKKVLRRLETVVSKSTEN